MGINKVTKGQNKLVINMKVKNTILNKDKQVKKTILNKDKQVKKTILNKEKY